MISVTERTVQTALTMRMTPFVLFRRLGEQKSAGKEAKGVKESREEMRTFGIRNKHVAR